jgi:NAD(P)-dependent dehydrogenase (short-subunit alcohol dehydrogenase family)
MSFFDLSGQTALVTGGAAGIGEAISRRLAAAGATVFIADVDEASANATSESIPGSGTCRWT